MSTDMLADRTYDEDVLTTTEIGRSLGTDYFGLRDELTEAEREYLKSPGRSSTPRCCRSSAATGSAPSSRGR